MIEGSEIFSLQGVSKRYGNLKALDNVSLSIAADEYISLLGPSGSGKSSLLRVIAGFDAPDAGRIYFNGRDITAMPAHQRGIGFVFQNFALFPHLTVFDNVAFGLVNGETSIPAREIKRRTREAIALVGLSGLEDRGVHEISGGQKQRVALARTLVMEPKLVLLDEPLGALDANLRLRMRNELRAIREQLGIIFLHVTGSENEALAMGDRVVVLDRGRVIQFAPPAEVYAEPASPNVARFLNRYNLFEGEISGTEFTGTFGKVKVGAVKPFERDVYAVRYDRMHAQNPEAAGAGPSLPAAFVASEYFGSSLMYFFATSSGKIIEIEHHLSMGPPLNFVPNAQYILRWNADDAIVFGRSSGT